MRLPCSSLLFMMMAFCAVSYGQRQSLSNSTLMFRNAAKNGEEALTIGKGELSKDTINSNTIKPLTYMSLQAGSAMRAKQGKLYYNTLNLIVGKIQFRN